VPRIFNSDVLIIPDYEVIRHINTRQNSYMAWIGAGASVEARIKTGRQICDELRKEMAAYAKPDDEIAWARSELSWDDPNRRYSTCLSKYGPAAKRVMYFRQLIQGLQPAFSHHATALLMEAGFLKKTCLTTNFDKLIEIAFAQQGNSEYQAIRSDAEADFWRQEDDKCYVIKLHGDYDTYNILNTSEETVRIPKLLNGIVADAVRQSGLVVIGSSGFEESVLRLFEDLFDNHDAAILNLGLFWGVHVEGPKERYSSTVEKKVAESILAGSVSQDILELMERHNRKDRPCAFFPIWGAGNFFFDLVKSTENRAVIGRAARYLDHRMRLHHIFTEGGLTTEAITKRLKKLDEKELERRHGQEFRSRAETVTRIWKATGQNSHVVLDVLYGDITSRSLMETGDPKSTCRVVITPEDNFVSASGGAALALLKKAGSHVILNELSKFHSIQQRDVVITSGGELPLQYIFHGAATKLNKDGSSVVTPSDVTATMQAALNAAVVLRVDSIFVPLIATGLEGMKSEESLDAILLAAKEFADAHHDYPMHLMIVIRDEGILARKDAGLCLSKTLGTNFVLEKAPDPTT
jgi:O-acetyl-ADP-ribose deacetylase (regulator of RNase III)/NAD-dependent SIR2 family protein deacetylase